MATSLAVLFRRADPARFTCTKCGEGLGVKVLARPCEEHPKGVVEPQPCTRCTATAAKKRRRDRRRAKGDAKPPAA